MAYRPKHNYRSKDALERGDPDKKVMGRELSEDFEAISADLRSKEGQINDIIQNGGGGGGGPVSWDDVTGKPTEFPPESHTHEQGDIDGLEDRLTSIEGSISSGGGFVEAPNDGKLYGRQSEAWAEVVIPDAVDPDWADIQNKPTEYPPEAHTQGWDTITGTPSEYPPEAHTHQQGDIDGLEDRIVDIEGAIGELTGQLAFGGSYNASSGLVVTGNLPEYVDGQPLPDSSSVLATFVIVSVAGSNPEELGEGDWLVAGSSGWVAIKYGTAGSVAWDNIVGKPSDYPPSSHNHEIADVNGLSDALTDASAPTAWADVTGKPAEFPPEDHTHSQYLTTETDPTVPGHVKSISQEDIDRWNAGGSGGGGGAVFSVNGKTGTVVLSASDVGAEPAFSKNSGFNKNFGTTAGSVSEGNHTHNYSPNNHDHAGVYEPVISPKRSAFNKDFGTTSTTIAKGDHTHSQYLTSFTESDPTVPAHVKAISQTDIDKWNNPPSGGGGGKTYGNGNGITVNNTDDTIAMSGSYTGDFSATGNVTASKFLGTYIYRDSGCGIAFSYGGAVLPADGTGASVNGSIDLGQSDKKWKDGWFSGTVTAGGDVIAFSDARLKDNVETLDGSKVFEMRGVSFTKDGKESSGVIAQEIQKVAPELVHDDGEYLGVAYGNLVGYLIEAVKELKAEIESLKNG